MKLHFDDAVTLGRAKLLDPKWLSLTFGVQHIVHLECVAGQDYTPVNLSNRGCEEWAVVIVPTFGSNKELWSTKSVTVSTSGINFVAQIDTSVAYAYVEGRAWSDAVLCIKGYGIKGMAASLKVSIQLPLRIMANAAAEPRFDAVEAIKARELAKQYRDEAKAAADKLPNPTPADEGKTPVVNSEGKYTLSPIPIGSATWGNITGNIYSQTDLATILQQKADLVNGKVPKSQLPTIESLVIQPYEFYFTGMTDIIYSVRVNFSTDRPAAACNGLYEFAKPAVNGKPMYRKDSGHALFFGSDGIPIIAESETAETYIVKAESAIAPGQSLADLKWREPGGHEYPAGTVCEASIGVMKAIPGLVVSLTCNAGGYVIADMHVSDGITYICLEGISSSSACSDDTGATFVAYALVQYTGNAVPMLDVSSI